MNDWGCCWRKLRNLWKPPLQHSLWPAVSLVSVWGEAAWKKRGTRRRTSPNSPGNNAAPPSSPSLHLEALRTGSPAPSPSWWLWHFSWTGSWLPWFHWGRKKQEKTKSASLTCSGGSHTHKGSCKTFQSDISPLSWTFQGGLCLAQGYLGLLTNNPTRWATQPADNNLPKRWAVTRP